MAVERVARSPILACLGDDRARSSPSPQFAIAGLFIPVSSLIADVLEIESEEIAHGDGPQLGFDCPYRARRGGAGARRIKAALAAAKARGIKLGGIRRPDYRSYLVGGNAASNVARRRRQRARALDLSPIICELRDGGRSLHGIAAELTRRAIEAPGKGPKWYPVTVRRMFTLLEEKPPAARHKGRWQKCARR